MHTTRLVTVGALALLATAAAALPSQRAGAEDSGSMEGGTGRQTVNLEINYAANDKAVLYINGERKDSVEDYKVHKTFRSYYRAGTIITISSKNSAGWGGLVADIKWNGQHYVTGRDAYKARMGYADARINRLASTSAVSSCSWRTPVPVQVLPHHTFSKTFPYANNAQYIWARGLPSKSRMLLRFVLGGEQCSAVTPTPSPSPLASTKCGCKRSADARKGDCYFFSATGTDALGLRKCKKRDCEATFECSSNAPTNQCIRKYATHEVRMIRAMPDMRTFKCLLAPLVSPKVFLVPYA